MGLRSNTLVGAARILFACLLLGFVSCQHTPQDEPGETTSTDPERRRLTSTELDRIQFDDIPVPRKFLLRNQRNESFTFVSGRTKVGRLVYWSRLGEREIREFFLAKMREEPYGWRLLSTDTPTDTSEMLFEKGSLQCEISFVRERMRSPDEILTILHVR